MNRRSMSEIKAEIRATCDAQARTTSHGKALAALDAHSLDRLINAIANNLAQTVDGMLAEALGEQEAA